VAAITLARVMEGKAGLEQLYAGMVQWRVRLVWWAVAVLGPAALFGLAVLLVRLMGGPWPEWGKLGQVAEYPQLGFGALLVAEVLFYGYGEEIGWRGYMLPRLQNRYSALWASVVISIGWAIWHLPLFWANESYRQMGAAATLGWYLSMLTGSILTTWLYNSSGGSILLLALFHGLLDLVMINQAVSPEMMNIMGMLATLWGIVVLLWARPARLSHRPKVMHPAVLSSV
jgi:membrane protease YdiL (CAAX protease family)